MSTKRLKRILILLRCLIRALFNGRANTVSSGNISTVMVVPTGKLGDVVCVTPVLYAIRKYLPKARIIAVGNSKLHRPLLSDSGLVDEYIDLEESGALARIKKYNAEAALVTGPSFEPTALFFLAGIPLVIAPQVVGGISSAETRPYRILQKFIETFPYKMGAYAPRERLKALEPLGIFADDTTKHLGFSAAARNKIEELISKISTHKYLIGVSAGSGNREKQWPPANFAEVADYLISKYTAQIILIGAKNDLQESNEMMAAIKNKEGIIDTTNSLSIDELKALVSKLDVFISVNTGPTYVAEAFDVSTVDLIGPVSPWDQPPQGEIHKMVFAPGNPKPLLYVLDTRNHKIEDAELIAKSTRVEDVIVAVESALKGVDERKRA